MNEELDSQLSAMFDDELAPQECELLARRLSRDETLKARWGRYAVMGAVIRAERGVRLNVPLAGRVSAVLLAEPELPVGSAPGAARRGRLRWWQPVAATAVAAGVAAVSIGWLRSQSELPAAPLTAQLPATSVALPRGVGEAVGATGPAVRAESYVVPPVPAARATPVPSGELANYVLAHSVFSSPVARRNLLSAFMSSEPAAGAEEPRADVKSGGAQ